MEIRWAVPLSPVPVFITIASSHSLSRHIAEKKMKERFISVSKGKILLKSQLVRKSTKLCGTKQCGTLEFHTTAKLERTQCIQLQILSSNHSFIAVAIDSDTRLDCSNANNY